MNSILCKECEKVIENIKLHWVNGQPSMEVVGNKMMPMRELNGDLLCVECGAKHDPPDED